MKFFKSIIIFCFSLCILTVGCFAFDIFILNHYSEKLGPVMNFEITLCGIGLVYLPIGAFLYSFSYFITNRIQKPITRKSQSIIAKAIIIAILLCIIIVHFIMKV